MNAERILGVVERAQRIQSDILKNRKPADLHIDTQFTRSLVGYRPAADLYGVSVALFYGEDHIYASLLGEDDIDEMEDALVKIAEIVNNL